MSVHVHVYTYMYMYSIRVCVYSPVLSNTEQKLPFQDYREASSPSTSHRKETEPPSQDWSWAQAGQTPLGPRDMRLN